MASHKPLPPLEELNRLFELRDGVLYWNEPSNLGITKGSACGTKDKRGYIVIRYNRLAYRAHRIIYCMAYGIDPKELEVDHINGIKSDNRPENLRLATRSENQRNRQFADSRNKSGFRGVRWEESTRKWRADITVNGRSTYIGRFISLQDAAESVTKARAELFGEFAGCST
jgi:hypothetical protein